MRRGIALLLVILSAVAAAAQERLRFDVASVKPTEGARGLRGGLCSGPNTEARITRPGPEGLSDVAAPNPMPPGACRYQEALLRDIIAAAYGVRNVVGGPSWLDSERFDIDAKADRVRPQNELHQMLQVLLEERFALRVRRETRPVDGFALVRADGAVRLKPSEVAAGGLLSRYGSLTTPGAPMPRLAQFLGSRIGRLVVDETGLAGNYGVTLTWTPADDEQPLAPGTAPEMERALRVNVDGNGPSLFTAVTEQLGLRLEARKVPQEFLVIDAVERPTRN
jgi:uncharacterized protein (TIGR03435 family)